MPIALFMAAVCIPAAFMKLWPKWIVIFGLILAGIGALSWFSMIFPKTCFLIPLTIFPGIIWMIAAGFKDLAACRIVSGWIRLRSGLTVGTGFGE